MSNLDKYDPFFKTNKNNDISEAAFQVLFDINTLNVMSLEYEPVELVNKITGTQILPPGKEFTTAPLLTSKTGVLELWLTNEYDNHRKKNMIIHLNTLFESYLYNFAKFWIERKPSIVNNYTVSPKHIKNKNKQEIFDTKLDIYIELELLRGKYSKAMKNFKKEINVDFGITKSDLNELDEFYQIRNTLVHSNGIIGIKLVSMFPKKNYKKGEKLIIGSKYIRDIENLLRKLILKIDNYLIQNFHKLATKSSSETEGVAIHYTYT